ncbi:anti-sigma factor [Ramlibacter sp. USB13]|uniref:Anti-sigma factor n=2 Tax=Ramlibacter cellulosilyticus TaxID=2764187 RepID=A0A923SDJ1_9BURK|nr:anti-sigma factor [Ramlibacter cellulosilyticus]
MDNQELISALADGQLQGEALALGVQAAAADARGREAWCAYHAVGEVLRTGRASTGTSPEVFLARLQRRLQEEQAAPVASARAVVVAAPREAANDWRWKIAAGVASVAAVAAVGWNLWGAGTVTGQPQLAAAPGVPAVVEASATPMMRDARLDKLLAAHRQLGGASALGTTSNFLRNATFEGPAR